MRVPHHLRRLPMSLIRMGMTMWRDGCDIVMARSCRMEESRVRNMQSRRGRRNGNGGLVPMRMNGNLDITRQGKRRNRRRRRRKLQRNRVKCIISLWGGKQMGLHSVGLQETAGYNWRTVIYQERKFERYMHIRFQFICVILPQQSVIYFPRIQFHTLNLSFSSFFVSSSSLAIASSFRRLTSARTASSPSDETGGCATAIPPTGGECAATLCRSLSRPCCRND